MSERFKNKVLISEGNFSSSFLAYDKKLEKNVFIKVFPKENRIIAEEEFRFLSKVRYKTPHVYELLADEGGEKLVLVEEFISGKNLKDIIDEVGKLPLPIALFITEEILRFLNFINSMGLYHGDISAENILISFDGKVYVADPAPSPDIATPDYFPDHNMEKSIKVDMFALSVLICEMILGLPPEKIKKSVLGKDTKGKLIFLSKLPEKLKKAVQNALYMKYMSPADFLREIIEFSAREGIAVFEGELAHFLREKEFKWEYIRKEKKISIVGGRTFRFLALLSLITAVSSFTFYILSGKVEEKKTGEVAIYKNQEVNGNQSKLERKRKLRVEEQEVKKEGKKEGKREEAGEEGKWDKKKEIKEKERKRVAELKTEKKLPPKDSRLGRRHAYKKASVAKQKVARREKIVGDAGLLSLNSFPFSKVFINGRFVDYTPITKLKLGAGRYKVELVSEDGKRKVFSVQIKEGREIKIFVNLLSGRVERTVE